MVINMVKWYCEILILVHFESDGTCQILKFMCKSEWPLYYCFTYKWQGILPGAPNENIVQNHLNIALLNVF